MVLGVFLFSGFGCKGLSQEQQQAVAPVTLEYWTVFDDVDALKKQIELFKVSHPYVQVTIRQLRGVDFYNTLVEALADDQGPDIISVSNRSVKSLQSRLAPFPASYTDTTVEVQSGTLGNTTVVNKTTQPGITISQLDRDFVQTVKKDVVLDGKIYGLPLSVDTMAIYYNKDVLDRSGIPEPPKTWEDFQTAVRKITKYDKDNKIIQSGVALGTGQNIAASDDILSILFRQRGLSFTSTDGRPVFNSNTGGGQGQETPAMEVMNFYTDFANPNRDTYSWNAGFKNGLDNFVQGSVGFYLGYSFNYNQIKARAPQLNFSVMPMLQLNNSIVNAANYSVQSVLLKSKNKDIAFDLLHFLTHSSATKQYLLDSGRPSALRSYISDQLQKPELAPFASQLLVADNWYKGENYAAAQAAIQEMIDMWLQVPTALEANQILEWKQNVLNRAVAKITQTL